MKHKITLLVLVLSSLYCSAQNINFSVKAGLNLSNTRFSVNENGRELDREALGHIYDTRTSFYIAASAEFLLNSKKENSLTLQIELQYSQQGHNNSDFQDFPFEINQINLPVVLKVTVYKGFSAFGGSYLGHVIKVEEDNGREDFGKDSYYSFDAGVVLGLEYKFNSRLFIETKYLYGLLDITDFESTDFDINWVYKNRVFQVGIGYTF